MTRSNLLRTEPQDQKLPNLNKSVIQLCHNRMMQMHLCEVWFNNSNHNRYTSKKQQKCFATELSKSHEVLAGQRKTSRT